MSKKRIFRKILIYSIYALLFWLIISVIFINNNWWFFVIFVCGLIFAYLYIVKDELVINLHLVKRLRFIFSNLIIPSIIFVIACLVISAWFLLGFLVIGGMLYILYWLPKDVCTCDMNQTKDKVIYVSVLAYFAILFLGFCIPSYIANSHSNPDIVLYNSYDAVPSYSVYGGGELDREHVIPQSWFVNNGNYVNDYVNIIWSNKYANSYRGNRIFGNVNEIEDNEIKDDNQLVGYRDLLKGTFEPLDEYKGDVARIVLYMYVTYKDDEGFDKSKINVNLMKQWSRIDPVSQEEIDRNNLIQNTFGYKNKFVSNPGLIRFIV